MREGLGVEDTHVSGNICLAVCTRACFGPVCCVSVAMCVHVSIFVLICTSLCMFRYNLLVSIPKLSVCVQVLTHIQSLRAYVSMHPSTHVHINTRRHLGTHVT